MGGISAADMQCRGAGNVRVSALEHMLGSSVATWRGVDASVLPCQMRPCPCMLLITAGNALTLEDSSIVNVTAETSEDAVKLPQHLICIMASTVVMRNTSLLANGAAGLSVRNGSNVTLDRCRIQDSFQGSSDIKGGALSSLDNNTITILDSEISGNNCTLGCGVLMSTGRLHVARSVFANNNAFQLGGALLLSGGDPGDGSAFHVQDSAFVGNSAQTDAGAISVESANLTLVNVTLEGNVANRSGGGLFVAFGELRGSRLRVVNNTAQKGGGLSCTAVATIGANASVHLTDSLLRHNAALQFGGGLIAEANCNLLLDASNVTANRAGVPRLGTGGGVHVNRGASLALRRRPRVTNNTATRLGGGVRLMTGDFRRADVRAATAGGGNRALGSPGAGDVSIAPVALLPLNGSAVSFVPGQGCQLHLVARVLGWQRQPSVGEDVEASVEGFKELTATAVSDARGDAHLHLRMYVPPGTYRLQLRILSDPDIEPRFLNVSVLPCPQGFVHEMQQSDWTCYMCPSRYYSLDPNATACSLCPANSSNCIGAQLWPKASFWHSAPTSPQFIRCLNPAACKGGQQPPGPWQQVRAQAEADMGEAVPADDVCALFVPEQLQQHRRRALLQQQTAAGSVQQYKDSLCATGYAGNLCGVCTHGYSRVRSHTCKACQPPAVILVLYILAALTMLLVMKLVLVFATRDCQTDPSAALLALTASASAGLTPVGSGGVAPAPAAAAGRMNGSSGGGAAAANGSNRGAAAKPLVGHAIELAMIADAAVAAATASAASISSGTSDANGPFAAVRPSMARLGSSSSGSGGGSAAAAANGSSRLGGSSGGGGSNHGSSGGGGVAGFFRLKQRRLRSKLGGSSGGGGGGGSASSAARAGGSRGWHLKGVSATDVAKPFILYAQYLFIVCAMNIEWPATLDWPIKVIDWFWSAASSHTLSIDCLLQHSASGVPLAMRKTLVDVCMPLLLLACLLVLEALLGVWRRARSRFGYAIVIMPPGHVTRCVIVVVFFFLPFLVRTALGMFACKPLDMGDPGPGVTLSAVGSYWLSDMNTQCWQSYHRPWALGLGVPLALALCVLLPAWVGWKTWSHRRRLSQARFRQRFGFLTRSYKPACCWWEAVVILETVALCVAAAYAATLGAFYQALLMLAAFAAMFVLLLCVQPHANATISRLALQGNAALFVTVWLVLTLLPADSVGLAAPPTAYGLAVGVLVLLVNLAHICHCLVLLVRSVNWRAAKAGTAAVAAKARAGTLNAVSSVRTTVERLRTSTSSGGGGGGTQQATPFRLQQQHGRLSSGMN